LFCVEGWLVFISSRLRIFSWSVVCFVGVVIVL